MSNSQPLHTVRDFTEVDFDEKLNEFWTRHRPQRGLDEYVTKSRVDSDYSELLKSLNEEKSEEIQLTELAKKLKEKYRVHIFYHASVEDIINSITNGESVDGINILERMQDPRFRFISASNPNYSLQISHAFAKAIAVNKSVSNKKASQVGVKKRQQNADEFAKNMKEVIDNVKTESNITTYKDTVEALNKKGIASYRGKKWHIRTLQDLYKRWEALGLSDYSAHEFSPPY